MDIAERECVQKLLETKLPHEVYEEINDKDLDNLVKSGFTTPHVLAAAGRDDLVRVLPGRLGVVGSLVAAFGAHLERLSVVQVCFHVQGLLC
jgi:hypothetical protein